MVFVWRVRMPVFRRSIFFIVGVVFFFIVGVLFFCLYFLVEGSLNFC
jgi:hypothetical protein